MDKQQAAEAAYPYPVLPGPIDNHTLKMVHDDIDKYRTGFIKALEMVEAKSNTQVSALTDSHTLAALKYIADRCKTIVVRYDLTNKPAAMLAGCLEDIYRIASKSSQKKSKGRGVR